jgi:hypothetical protein
VEGSREQGVSQNTNIMYVPASKCLRDIIQLFGWSHSAYHGDSLSQNNASNRLAQR